jgi:hypothetical protein
MSLLKYRVVLHTGHVSSSSPAVGPPPPPAPVEFRTDSRDMLSVTGDAKMWAEAPVKVSFGEDVD